MLKIYGSMMCPDCVKCREDLDKVQVGYEYHDFGDSLLALKEFLTLRDQNPVFTEVKDSGKIGIPCIVRQDGSVTLSWEEFM